MTGSASGQCLSTALSRAFTACSPDLALALGLGRERRQVARISRAAAAVRWSARSSPTWGWILSRRRAARRARRGSSSPP